jgi:glutathione transport system substrate-binding protein
MNHAINKDQLIAQVMDGYGKVADSAIASTVFGYAQQSVYEYDVEKAKQAMTDAGYPDGFKATLWTRNATEFVSVAEFVAMQLKEIGIDVEVQTFESGTLFDKLDSGVGTDIWIGRWGPGTGEADYGLRPNFATDRIPPNWNNSGSYINAQVDQLLNEALQSPDQDVTLAKYKELQEIIYADAPWIFLYVPDLVAAKRSEVKDAFIDRNGTIRLNQASVE